MLQEIMTYFSGSSHLDRNFVVHVLRAATCMKFRIVNLDVYGLDNNTTIHYPLLKLSQDSCSIALCGRNARKSVTQFYLVAFWVVGADCHNSFSLWLASLR